MVTVRSADDGDVSRARLTQLFRFLQALDQLRNPVVRVIDEQPWSLRLASLPEHDCVRLGRGRAESQDASEFSEEANAGTNEDFILRVRRPPITQCPKPPELIANLLAPGWSDIDGELALKHDDPGGGIPAEKAYDVQTAFENFARERANWQKRERPAREAMRLFEALYNLKSKLDRESEIIELILGDGVLRWRYAPGERIDHPVLIQRLQLLFEPSIPEFTILEADTLPEFYTALFRGVRPIDANVLGNARSEVDTKLLHPLAGQAVTDFLRRLVGSLSPHGRFLESPSDHADLDDPVMVRDPMIYLRRRTLGFGRAIELALEDIRLNPITPKSLSAIVGIEPQSAPVETGVEATLATLDESPDVLFTKPANAEQVEVAKRLSRYGLVLVQGPPGTGKTHTIGNIIGHLLAKGKTILVTSHTSKALRVLRDQVVEALQPLCVSVLDDSGKQMSDAIDAITDRLSQSDAESLAKRSDELDKSRRALIERVRSLRKSLTDSLQDEYRAITVGGKDYSPAEAARYIRKYGADAGWIPGTIARGSPMPVSSADIRELYRTNGAVTPEDEQESLSVLPDISRLIEPYAFEGLVSKRRELTNGDTQFGQEYWRACKRDVDELRTVVARVLNNVSDLQAASAWEHTIITHGRTKGPRRDSWENLISLIRNTSHLANIAYPFLVEHDPKLGSNISLEEARGACGEIVAHLRRGGKLNLWVRLVKPSWRRFIRNAKVNERRPSQHQEFRALQCYLDLEAERKVLRQRWERQVQAIGGPDLGSLKSCPEQLGSQLVPRIQKLLNWYKDTWAPDQECLVSLGFDVDRLLGSTPIQTDQNAELKRLIIAITSYFERAASGELCRMQLAELDGTLNECSRYLDEITASGPSGAILKDLKEAIRELQPERYAKAYARVAELHNKQNIVRRRRDLLAKLKNAAPDWARSIELREGLHGRCDPPGDPEIAWLWKQFTQELDRRASTDIDALRKELADRSTDLQRLTAELVAHKAWAAQIKRTSLHQRQALQGWKKLMLKVPKGKGIRKPRLLDEARKLMPVCQTAIPVWIMPLSRVVETFDPRANRFDVIIIDEASQADVMSLAALYLGNEIMVVGDHEQVTPAAIGAKLDEVQKLIDEYLTEIPNANLYDGQTSVYDLAGTSYPGMVSLREHFRCAKQIIQFSTHLSYNGKILPLRDTGDVRTKPHCIAFRVSDGSYDGTINENEARWVAALLIACIEQEEYAESTFGVISLVGEEQALRIDQILHTVLPPMEYQRRHIQCGNAAQFQGDERDIVFLSLVDSPPERPPLTMRGEGYQGVYKKRFNVAASRARDQLWVVHSLDPQRDLKPGDLRLRLIRHAENPDSLDAEIERKEAQAESEFERQVIQALVREGFDVRPQWKVGAYRIDMVVISGDKKVAVECDGDKWHPPEKTVEDIGRQVLLERLGWKNFIRIRGSEYFRAPDKTIRKVVRRLQMLGIQASDHVEADGKTLSELYQRVERRAAELIRQWNDEGLGPVVVSFTKTNGRSQGINGNVKSENLQETGSNVAEVHCGEFDNLPTPRQQNRDQQVDPSDLPGLLRARGLEVIDKRHLGGNLWVVGGPEMEPIISEFKRQGIQFQFKERGGKATRHRPAWFTSYGSIPPTDQRAE